MSFEEKPIRTVFKTISWRVIAVLATIIGIYLYKGELASSIAVGIAINLVKMFLYYIHERGWNKVSFGRVAPRPPEYQI